MNTQMLAPMIDLFFAKLVKARRLSVGKLAAYELDGLIRVTHPTLGVCFLTLRDDPREGLVITYAEDRRQKQTKTIKFCARKDCDCKAYHWRETEAEADDPTG